MDSKDHEIGTKSVSDKAVSKQEEGAKEKGVLG